jgi:hypothetical protein
MHFATAIVLAAGSRRSASSRSGCRNSTTIALPIMSDVVSWPAMNSSMTFEMISSSLRIAPSSSTFTSKVAGLRAPLLDYGAEIAFYVSAALLATASAVSSSGSEIKCGDQTARRSAEVSVMRGRHEREWISPQIVETRRAAPFDQRMVLSQQQHNWLCGTGATGDGPMSNCVEGELGPVACLRIEGARIAVSSVKMQIFDRNLFRVAGIEPEGMKILVKRARCIFARISTL